MSSTDKGPSGTESLVEEFERSCRGVRMVSFDVFDTLVRRSVAQPNHLFLALERELSSSQGLGWASGLAAVRADAEARARRQAWDNESREEVALDEIWQEVGWALGWSPDDSRLASLAEAEIDLELRMCVPNELGTVLFERALALGKRVIAVSDTYLPAPTIETILKSCGFGEIDAMYTSSAHMRTKTTGSIWPVVLRETQLPAREILHVGDNLVADVEMPLESGLGTFMAPSWSPQFKWCAPLRTDLLPYSVMSQRARHDSASSTLKRDGREILPYGLGSSVGAVLLGGYANWLADQIPDSVDTVMFLSRDGFVVQEAMEAIGREPRLGRRLWLSRRVLRAAALDRPSQVTIHAVIEPFERPTKSILTALQRLSLANDQRLTKMVTQRLGPLDAALDMHALDELTDILLHDFRDEVRAAARPALSKLREYLSQEGALDGTHAIIDAGWHGSMQANLHDVVQELGGDARFYGYYFALHQGAQEFRPSGGPMFGFLSDDFSHTPERRAVIECVDFIEEILLPGIGSVVGYSRDSEGLLTAQLQESPVEVRNYTTFVRDFQAGALNVLRRITSGSAGWPRVEDFTAEAVSAALQHLLLYPSDQEINVIGRLGHLPGVNHDGEGYLLASLPAYEGQQAVIDLTGYLWSSGSLRRTWNEQPHRRDGVREAAERLRWAYGQSWIDHLTRGGE